MHSVVRQVLEQSEKERATRVHRIKMRIGTFSGVVPEALRFAFEVLTQGTPAAGAVLEVEMVAARSTCARCGAEYEVRDLASLACPDCHGDSDGFRGGRQIELSEIEVS